MYPPFRPESNIISQVVLVASASAGPVEEVLPYIGVLKRNGTIKIAEDDERLVVLHSPVAQWLLFPAMRHCTHFRLTEIEGRA